MRRSKPTAADANATTKYTDRYIRATWYVDKEKVKAIKRIAIDTDRDTSDLIREAMDMVIAKYQRK